MNSLESLLRTVQQLKLKRLRVDELEETQFIAAGETFAVSQCRYQGSVIAVKRIRLNEYGEQSDRQHFQRRLQSVLREVLIMCHPPLAHHPNIISLLGYGWTVEEQRPSPFVSVEFASNGSLREYMKLNQTIRTKFILMGDVGAGLMALHKCGIVHGDLKMENVVVFASLERPSGSIAKISDFGHSILASSTPEKRTRYFGTALYNAPEVAHQRNQPIPADQLHKCDIWAFGLCAWEILADGQVYFQRSWQNNVLYDRPPSYPDSWAMVTSPLTSETHNVSTGEDGHYVFGRFDPSHLEHLAVEFVNELKIPGVGFEKGMLRPLLSRTLQTDPNKRISDLSRLPIIGFWNKAPGGHSLQSKLATYTLSSEVRYSIFSRDTGPYIIWEQQQQLLQDFEAVAQRAQPQKENGTGAFQTMLCYVNAFGTSGNLTKAAEFLHKAEEAGHLIARILGPRMIDVFMQKLSDFRKEYSESLALGFEIIRQPQSSKEITVERDHSITKFASYDSFRQFILDEALGKDDIALMRVAPNASSVRLHPLEVAVQHGDIELVGALMPCLEDYIASNAEGEMLLVQAASRGHGAVVSRLLKAGAPIIRENSTTLLHWLFCLDASTLNEVYSYLQEWPRSSTLKPLLNQASTEKIILHPQWPFQVHGSPLATAITSGNLAAVKILLDLKADPLALAFATVEGDTLALSPIHLAIRYHFPEILQLLWQKAFGERVISGARPHLAQSLGSFPIACALSLLTNAERFAIHGSAYKQALRNTIKLLPMDILLQSSPEGKNALTQAIDLEDADTVELLLERFPELADRELVQPSNKGVFTYPLHFAVQIGSCRDTDESVRILETILNLDPTAIDRQDSSSVKPIHVAAMGSSTRITEFLLKCGASCHDLDGRGQGPLHFCRTASNAKILLSSGANINHKDQLGFTAAHAAATQGREEVLQTLIKAGADLSSRDNGIGTPLHCAIQRKSRIMTEMTLKAGAEIDAQDTHGRTPLLVAMDTGRSDLVFLIFDTGADPFIEDERDFSPFLMSLAWKTSQMLSRFQNHGSFEKLPWEKKVAALHFAAENGEPAALQQYLRKLPKPSSQTENPEYPRIISTIHKAAAACRVDLVDVLLSAGFKVDSLATNGNTPLLTACLAGRNNSDFYAYTRTYMCQRLLDKGANILAKNDKGLTPFAIAMEYVDYPLMTLLLEHALATNDLDVPARRSRILVSIKDPSQEPRFCAEARALIGDEVIDHQLIRNAVAKEEWDFIITCIGGHFVGKEDLDPDTFNEEYKWGADILDVLRFYCAIKDRKKIRHLYANASTGGRQDDIIRNSEWWNMEYEIRETKGIIDELLWPATRKMFARMLQQISTGPPRRELSISKWMPSIVPNWTKKSRPKKSKALTFDDVAQYGLEEAEIRMRWSIEEVEVLLEVMQKWTEKMAEVKDQGEKLETMEWARALLEELRSHLYGLGETIAILTKYCDSQCDSTLEATAAKGWDDLSRQGKTGSAKVDDLTKALDAAFKSVDNLGTALDKER
ncbi:uncharacterized protein N7498_000450 [Penicillium cinerascens]|uniref:Protein kinase domain-containing protein n=1 Tax=Penicillium cinerascens TaxID=70096 RepID=A0A9W9NED9_9EURO|nr:uncharacterized protein N7498_000450 [Penicillium cinerascens]KAJ5218351.1 hypothetical protein N7498_000450 [Penicillium cinerascens]